MHHKIVKENLWTWNRIQASNSPHYTIMDSCFSCFNIADELLLIPIARLSLYDVNFIAIFTTYYEKIKKMRCCLHIAVWKMLGSSAFFSIKKLLMALVSKSTSHILMELRTVMGFVNSGMCKQKRVGGIFKQIRIKGCQICREANWSYFDENFWYIVAFVLASIF